VLLDTERKAENEAKVKKEKKPKEHAG
jgi:hypothetical protein